MDEFVGGTGRLDLAMPACVARGVALLDHIYPVGMDADYPTWDSRVDLERLNMMYGDRCVFGQVVGATDYTYQAALLSLLDAGVITDPVIIEASRTLPLSVGVVYSEHAMFRQRALRVGIVYGFDRDVPPGDSDAFVTLTQLWTGIIIDRRK